ncbi:MAG: hypothetical protein HMLKMBBP_02689 [Planctomycetes bacterium]|nr:hypothetical protein [Planctomycetota bacterium]
MRLRSLTVGAWLAALDASKRAHRVSAPPSPLDDLFLHLRVAASTHDRLQRCTPDDIAEIALETAENLLFDSHRSLREAPPDEPLARALARAIDWTVRVRRRAARRFRRVLAAAADQERARQPCAEAGPAGEAESDPLHADRCGSLVAQLRRTLTPHEFRVISALARYRTHSATAKALGISRGAVAGALHSASHRAAHLAPVRPSARPPVRPSARPPE